MNDAHNHLQHCPDIDIDVVIETMRQAGVRRCVVNGTSPDDWPQVAALAKQHPDFVIPSFGLHPWKPVENGWLETLRNFLTDHPQAGVGECGLDRWMRDFDFPMQQEVFTQQIELATELNRPLSIHCLKAWGKMLEMLQTTPLPDCGFLLHSYAGPVEMIPYFVELGAYLSFSGYFLQERKESVREMFKQVPPDRLLIETDAPDMPMPDSLNAYPQFSFNHPANLAVIYREAGKFLNLGKVEENFLRVFR